MKNRMFESFVESFQTYQWRRKGPHFDENNEYIFTTKDGYEYKAFVDLHPHKEGLPKYEIGFGVVSNGVVDTMSTINSTDATDVVATVIDIIDKEIPEDEFVIIFEPNKDEKGQEAAQTKRGRVYLRMLDREGKKKGWSETSTDFKKDYILMRIKR